MGNTVKSARGVDVDFDLLKIKEQMVGSTTQEIKLRQDFIEKKLHRRAKKIYTKAAPKQAIVTPVQIPDVVAPVDVDTPTVPTTDSLDIPTQIPKTKQKIRNNT